MTDCPTHGHEQGYLLAEALIALALVAAVGTFVAGAVWQMGRALTGQNERHEAWLLARSVLAAEVGGCGKALARQGDDGPLQWRSDCAPVPGSALNRVTVRILDRYADVELARLEGIGATP